MTHVQDNRDWRDWGWPRPKGTEIELIVVHRTGNPRADALGNLAHSRRTKSWSIHEIVDATAWRSVVPHSLVAWHVKEARIARSLGYPVSLPGHDDRGDVAAVGIEVCENHVVARPAGDVGQKTIAGKLGKDGWPSLFTSPGGEQRFDPPTYRNLVECLIALRTRYPNARVVGHGHLDPFTRSTDPFWMLPRGWSGLLRDSAPAVEKPAEAAEAPSAPSTPQPDQNALYAPLEARVSAIEETLRAIAKATE